MGGCRGEGLTSTQDLGDPVGLGARHRRVGHAALLVLWHLETPMLVGMKM